MPTTAPTIVSPTRLSAADPAPPKPTPSTSIALIGTSMTFGPSLSSWPSMIETAMSSARLHHVTPVTDANRTARSTPATTLTTRSIPLVSVLNRVTWTTSSAVSGASSGSVCGENERATR
jgi:hypothetical protein